jgi:WD40 repeat protein
VIDEPSTKTAPGPSSFTPDASREAHFQDCKDVVGMKMDELLTEGFSMEEMQAYGKFSAEDWLKESTVSIKDLLSLSFFPIADIIPLLSLKKILKAGDPKELMKCGMSVTHFHDKGYPCKLLKDAGINPIDLLKGGYAKTEVYTVSELKDGKKLDAKRIMEFGFSLSDIKPWFTWDELNTCGVVPRMEGKEVGCLRGHDDFVRSLVELNDSRLASGSGDHTIKIWNMVTGACELTMTGHNSSVGILIQLKDGRLASGACDNHIKFWNVTSGKCVLTLKGHSDSVESLVQLSDGRLASGAGCVDMTIKLWNIVNGKCELTLTGHTSTIYTLIQLRDGRLASGCYDTTIKLWNVMTGACELTLNGDNHNDSAMVLVELSDGRLAIGSYDSTIKIWNVASGEREITLEGQNDHVYAYVLSMTQLCDGRLASGSEDTTIKIWNVTNGKCELKLRGHKSPVKSLVQLRDGRLASGSYGIIKLWK